MHPVKGSLKKEHHVQKKFCYNRPSYREARWERAVKVYTVSQESKYIVIQGVPAVGAEKELVKLFALYGDIDEYRLLHDYPTEEFTEVYWIKYVRIQSARFAKKKQDNRSFYGGILHVTYAPEFETTDETREKLLERKRSINRKTKEFFGDDAEGKLQKDHRTLDPGKKTFTSGALLSNVSSQPIDVPDETFTSNTSVGGFVPSYMTVLPSSHPPEHLGPMPVTAPSTSISSPISFASFPIIPPHAMGMPLLLPPPPPPPIANAPPDLQLPPPPMHLPPALWSQNSSTPSLPSSHRKVPSKNATLPMHIQVEEDIKAAAKVGIHKDMHGLPSSRNKVHCSSESADKAASGSGRDSVPRIVWMDKNKKESVYSKLPTEDGKRKEPGVWDPFKGDRKRERSVTGCESLDKATDNIREKLKKFGESTRPMLTNLYDIEEDPPVKRQTDPPKKKERKRI